MFTKFLLLLQQIISIRTFDIMSNKIKGETNYEIAMGNQLSLDTIVTLNQPFGLKQLHIKKLVGSRTRFNVVQTLYTYSL